MKLVLSPRKHINIPKRASNLDDFQKEDVLRRTVFDYNDRGEFLTAKNVTFALRVYKGSVFSTVRLLKHLGFQYKRTHDRRQFHGSEVTFLGHQFTRQRDRRRRK
jgi:hypothetical protein